MKYELFKAKQHQKMKKRVFFCSMAAQYLIIVIDFYIIASAFITAM